MLFIKVKIAYAVMLMLELASPATAVRHEFGIAADPPFATSRLNQRCGVITAETATFAGNRFSFQSVVCHSSPLFLYYNFSNRSPSWDFTVLHISDNHCYGAMQSLPGPTVTPLTAQHQPR
jgi:hypothetical protein